MTLGFLSSLIKQHTRLNGFLVDFNLKLIFYFIDTRDFKGMSANEWVQPNWVRNYTNLFEILWTFKIYIWAYLIINHAILKINIFMHHLMNYLHFAFYEFWIYNALHY